MKTASIRLIKKLMTVQAMAITAFVLLAMPIQVHGLSFKAALDSTHILMGKKTALKFSVITEGSPDGKVTIAKDSMPGAIEFSPTAEAKLSKKALGNGRYELTGEYILQSFDSGDYRIPGLLFITAHDTIESNAINLRVVPVETQPDQDIYDELPPLEPGKKFFDWVPNWWYWVLIGIAIIAAGIILYLILSKKVVIKLPTKAPEPPYEIARRQLNELKEQKLWESGQEKTYYTRLTDILRTYLHGRFGINAMELTSSQILSAIKALKLDVKESGRIKELLSTADFVKFAKLSPDLSNNIKSFNLAEEFIEATKPVPQPQTNESENKEQLENHIEAQKKGNLTGK